MAFSKQQPDKSLVKEQLEALQACHLSMGTEVFLAAMVWILAKQEEEFADAPAIIVPFRFNRIQRDLFPKLGRNNLFLKPRQVGGTTFFLLVRLFLSAITQRGIGCLLISQSNEMAEKHFRIVQRAHRYVGCANPFGSDEENAFSVSLKQHLLHTEASNKRELIFDQLESRIMIASAEVKEAAQGVTLHHVVASEYSRWPKDPRETLANVRGALVKTGSTDKECTANGAAGPFYEDCKRAMETPEESDATFHFYPWHWDDGYHNDLTEAQKDELIKDLKADELRLIARMHKDLQEVAWVA